MSADTQTEAKSRAKTADKARGASTRGRIARKVAGVDAIEIKATVADGQIDKALNRYHLTVDNDEERYNRRPVLKAGFPIPAATVVAVFDALGLPAPGIARPTYSLDELIEELIDPEPRLLALPVHKGRSRYPVPGGIGELTRRWPQTCARCSERHRAMSLR